MSKLRDSPIRGAHQLANHPISDQSPLVPLFLCDCPPSETEEPLSYLRIVISFGFCSIAWHRPAHSVSENGYATLVRMFRHLLGGCRPKVSFVSASCALMNQWCELCCVGRTIFNLCFISKDQREEGITFLRSTQKPASRRTSPRDFPFYRSSSIYRLLVFEVRTHRGHLSSAAAFVATNAVFRFASRNA